MSVEYYKLFYAMEAVGLLDPLNDVDLCALHWTYLPIINRSLREFQSGWKKHPLSGQKGLSPLQLFTTGIAKLQAEGRFAVDCLMPVDDSYGIDYDGPVPVDHDVVPPICVSFSEEAHELLTTMNVLRESDDFGIDIYEEIREIIKTYVV